MSEAQRQLYAQFLALFKEWSDLQGIRSLIEWDEETYMPKEGVRIRADQKALLAKLAHERLADPEFLSVLYRLADSALGNSGGEEAANIRVALMLAERERRVPAKLDSEIASHDSVASDVWREARQKSDFALFAPALEKTIRLQSEKAEAIGYETEPYEALFAEYEPGMSIPEVDAVFADLRSKLVPFVAKLLSLPNQPDDSILYQSYSIRKQEELSRYALELMGYDFNRGRLDVTTHPFCSSWGPWDVRLTTRYRGDYFGDAIFSAIHEGGHGLYEQGVDERYYGMPVGLVLSLGLHESQSRFWEAWVGRSSEFWQFLWPTMNELFPEVAYAGADRIFRAVNKPQRSFIRVDSDPVTYNLHIMLRYEIERKILKGEVKVSELPELWNSLMQQYVGITPRNDAEGVLQDVHWSQGFFGYFPTYTLGNIASAVIWEAMARVMPVRDLIRDGKLYALRDWLREAIHRYGSTYTLRETLQRLGASLDVDAFMRVLKARMSEVYETDLS